MPELCVRPVIGITLSARANSASCIIYCRPVEAHGAQVVAIFSGGQEVAVECLDGLLLSGGGDIAPCWYGASRHPKTANVDEARDRLELRLTQEALAAGMPVLGICRGAQVLGVALGGTLIQDIPSQVAGHLVHSSGANECARHRVRLAEGSRLRELIGCETVEVNSFHHQANERLGESVRATAWSDDNVIEAIERAGAPLAIGVQWHPERMCDEPHQIRLFAAFVAVSAEYARGRRRCRA